MNYDILTGVTGTMLFLMVLCLACVIRSCWKELIGIKELPRGFTKLRGNPPETNKKVVVYFNDESFEGGEGGINVWGDDDWILADCAHNPPEWTRGGKSVDMKKLGKRIIGWRYKNCYQ